MISLPTFSSWRLCTAAVEPPVYDVARLDGDGPGFTGVIRRNDRSEFGVKVGYTF